MNPLDWTTQAACLGVDLDVFYPDVSEHCDDAKRICATCPVVDACRDYALSQESVANCWGVFGGLSPKERQAILKDKAVEITHGTMSGYHAHVRRRVPVCDSCRAARRLRRGRAA